MLVTNHGRIIERGTHDTLLAQRGFYHDLYMGQFIHEEAAARARINSPEADGPRHTGDDEFVRQAGRGDEAAGRAESACSL